MERFAGDYSFGIVAMGNYELRYRYTLKLEDNCFKIPILIHPISFVGQYANIQKGCIIEPMATVQSGSILGVGVLVSAGCVVNHSIFIGDYCHLDVGSTVKSKSLMKAGTKLEAGEVFGRIDVLQENESKIASYQKDEKWVEQFIKDFGTEPSFF